MNPNDNSKSSSSDKSLSGENFNTEKLLEDLFVKNIKNNTDLGDNENDFSMIGNPYIIENNHQHRGDIFETQGEHYSPYRRERMLSIDSIVSTKKQEDLHQNDVVAEEDINMDKIEDLDVKNNIDLGDNENDILMINQRISAKNATLDQQDERMYYPEIGKDEDIQFIKLADKYQALIDRIKKYKDKKKTIVLTLDDLKTLRTVICNMQNRPDVKNFIKDCYNEIMDAIKEKLKTYEQNQNNGTAKHIRADVSYIMSSLWKFEIKDLEFNDKYTKDRDYIFNKYQQICKTSTNLSQRNSGRVLPSCKKLIDKIEKDETKYVDFRALCNIILNAQNKPEFKGFIKSRYDLVISNIKLNLAKYDQANHQNEGMISQ